MTEQNKKYELPDTYNIDNVEIMAVGVWNGDKYTEKDLDGLVKSFNETKQYLKPYLKLGHNESQKLADDMPALGWIDKLRKVGGKLVADFVKIPKTIYELIKAGAYRRVSSEVYFNIRVNNKHHERALKAVSLLGAVTPAVENLADIIALYKQYDKNEYDIMTENNTWYSKEYEFSEKELKQEDLSMDELARLNQKVADLEKKYDEEKAKCEELKEEVKEKEKQVEEKSQEAEKAKEEKEKVEGEVKQNKRNARVKELEAEADKLIEEKHLLPADKESYLNIVKHFELDSEEVKKYKVGDKEVTFKDMFDGMIKKYEVDINTEEKSEIGENKHSSKDDSALDEKAKKYMKDNNVSYKEALKAVAE